MAHELVSKVLVKGYDDGYWDSHWKLGPTKKFITIISFNWQTMVSTSKIDTNLLMCKVMA